MPKGVEAALAAQQNPRPLRTFKWGTHSERKKFGRDKWPSLGERSSPCRTSCGALFTVVIR
eukprot:1320-Heterococcus_DN1.PRE.1